MEKTELQIYDADNPMYQFKKYMLVDEKWDEISSIRTSFSPENDYLLRSFIDYIFEIEYNYYKCDEHNICINFVDESRFYYYGNDAEEFENKYLTNYIDKSHIVRKK